MEDIPPSYEAATNPDVWAVIAPYIRSSDLCAACLVSQHWHHVFAKSLWGNPAAHFGTEDNVVYGVFAPIALTRFKRTLPRVRLSVRQLVHTLHLPPAQSELYGGPNAEWLRDVLENLPSLQSLIVSGLPFFDPCGGAGWANNVNVLRQLGRLPSLQILKLRKCGLRDGEVEALAAAIKLRVRSLDLSSNSLTNRSIDTLLQHCFLPLSRRNQGTAAVTRARAHSHTEEDWPVGISPRNDDKMLDLYTGEDLEMRTIKLLTGDFVGRLPIEDLPQAGITHLYISDTNVTARGIRKLLESTRLTVLDCGSLDSLELTTPTNLSREQSSAPWEEHGAGELAPVLANCVQENLVYLQVYAELSANPDQAELDTEREIAELDTERDVAEMNTEREAAELDITNRAGSRTHLSAPVHELPGSTVEERFELPGDFVYPCTTKSSRPAVTIESPAHPKARRGSVFAPEAVTPTPIDDSTAEALGSNNSAQNTTHDKGQRSLPGTHVSTTEMLLAKIDAQRKLLRAQNTKNNSPTINSLRPFMLPKLRTLVLEDVPSVTLTEEEHNDVVDRLVQFIKDCAAEDELARLEGIAVANQDKSPRSRHLSIQSTHQPSQKKSHPFYLKSIVLEMGPEWSINTTSTISSPSSINLTTIVPISTFRRPQNSKFKSSTEDADSEAFWRAAEHDFSFFDEGEECGLPALEPQGPSFFQGHHATEKMAVLDENNDDDSIGGHDSICLIPSTFNVFASLATITTIFSNPKFTFGSLPPISTPWSPSNSEPIPTNRCIDTHAPLPHPIPPIAQSRPRTCATRGPSRLESRLSRTLER
ncbi:MAG: hypothetical protein M1819_006090 [Sarea resinae]|nr:MAG: hypothetical protein M1819_006090 [Sarea resinae]